MTQVVQIEVSEGGRAYTYRAPDEVKVGDVVVAPTRTGQMTGTVVKLGSSYTGPMLEITEVIA